MVRYQIVYSKSGQPLYTWASDIGQARLLAARLRKVGYKVEVWAHDQDGSHLIDI